MARLAADAVVITLNRRLNCNTVTVQGQTFHYVYYSGSVEFTNPAHVVLRVRSYFVVGGEEIFVGAQEDGFGNPPGTSTYQWARCADFELRPQGTGPHVSRDKLWRSPLPGEGMDLQFVGQGDKNWNP